MGFFQKISVKGGVCPNLMAKGQNVIQPNGALAQIKGKI